MKILYIMHISWGWIKQRPQFIAEELAKKCKVDVLYRMSNRRGKDLNPCFKNGNLSVKGFRNWPTERIKFLPIALTYQINKLIWNFENIDLSSYDFIWVTDPVLWWTIKGNFRGGGKPKVIYDCMDDYSAFPYMNDYPKYKIFNEEKELELIKSADFVFCTAKALQIKLYNRYGVDREYVIINNAITKNITTYEEEIDGIELPEKSLVYIGTVSEWFDFENTLKALDDYKDLHVVLYGPKRMSNIPVHPRLEFRGTTDHTNILAIMNNAKGLFMPFVINELIESVNPVKLYEYIYSGKPILATKYGESEPFKDYVTLYSNYSEFSNFVRDCIMADQNNNKEDMQRYAMNNTWEARAEQILKLMTV